MSRPLKIPRPFSVGPVRVRVVGSMGTRLVDGVTRWYFRAERHKDGQSRATWSGWATLDEATRAVARLVGGLPRTTEQGPLSLTALLEDWVGERESQLEAGTIALATFRAQRYAAEHLAGVIGAVLVDRVDRVTLDRYRDARLRAGAAPLTTRHELATLRAAWRWGRETGRCEGDLPTVRLPGGHVRDRHTPSRGEVVAILGQLQGWRRAIVYLYASTGCRLGELARLRWGDVDLDRGEVRVVGKTGPRTVPLTPPACRVLEAWRASLEAAPAPGDRCWGVSADTARHKVGPVLARACRDAGVPAVTTNGLRRAVVDQLYRSGGDIAAAAAVAGHSPEMAMRVYRQVTADDARAAASMARLGYLDEGEVLDLATRRKR